MTQEKTNNKEENVEKVERKPRRTTRNNMRSTRTIPNTRLWFVKTIIGGEITAEPSITLISVNIIKNASLRKGATYERNWI